MIERIALAYLWGEETLESERFAWWFKNLDMKALTAVSHYFWSISSRNEGCRGYRPKQTCELALNRSHGSRNAREVQPWVKRETDVLLGLQWSSEHIAGKLPVSHETLYLHVYG